MAAGDSYSICHLACHGQHVPAFYRGLALAQDSFGSISGFDMGNNDGPEPFMFLTAENS
jgi:hypothetical protein